MSIEQPTVKNIPTAEYHNSEDEVFRFRKSPREGGDYIDNLITLSVAFDQVHHHEASLHFCN